MRVAQENGPKGKKFVCYAIDWPGLERGGKTPEIAFANMSAYRDRYALIAARAGMGELFSTESEPTIVEEYTGPGSTDFWGISFGQSPIDLEGIDADTFEKRLLLLQACWQEFDETAERVTPELKKGPRGGGRDRDHIVRHVIANELQWTGIGLDYNDVSFPLENRRQFHLSVVDHLRNYYEVGPPPKKGGGVVWTLPFFVRHLAYHVMDHAWEMQDKDLTQEAT